MSSLEAPTWALDSSRGRHGQPCAQVPRGVRGALCESRVGVGSDRGLKPRSEVLAGRRGAGEGIVMPWDRVRLLVKIWGSGLSAGPQTSEVGRGAAFGPCRRGEPVQKPLGLR